VPYKSFGPALTDTIAGRVGFFLSAYGALLPHIKSGSVRALAIGSVGRSELLPDVPTFAEEMGVPGYESAVWYGMLAPAGTPADVVAALNDQVGKALENAQVRDKIHALGAEISLMPSAQFGALVRSDTDKWTKVVKSIGLEALQ
jgi:tripartite-type tricarboxylate transporter receptor subunit TctC